MSHNVVLGKVSNARPGDLSLALLALYLYSFKMAVKRKRGEDVSEVDSACTDMSIHGIVTQLSPVKVSHKNEKVRYFDGKLSDGKKTLRVVSFAK